MNDLRMIDWVVVGLATYRAASIVAQEDVFAPVRNWLGRERVARQGEIMPRIQALQQHLQQLQVRSSTEQVGVMHEIEQWQAEASRWDMVPQPRRWLGQLVSCVFCVSVWAGWILVAGWLYGGVVGQVAVGGLAASGAAVSLGSWLANGAKRGG